ncbi:MAG: PAS domain S-box protein [Phycisphaerae bacterium]|nr:PAS domain S-box protein [Phycisphaerae bacterium]
MKEAIRESEEKYRDLFENAREAIVLTDLNGTITGVNRLVEDYGFQREESIGRSLFGFVAEDHRTRAMADFKVLLGGQPVKGEMEVLTPRGVVCVEYRDNPILRGGQVVGVQALLTDVTKRKRAEQLLREERDRVQRYLDIAGVMLVVIDSEQRVGLINKKGCEILGYTEQEILGKNCFNHFLPPRIREHIRAVFAGLMAGRIHPNEQVENVVLTRTGQERLMAWHNTVLRNETGQIIGTLGSGEDITERRRTEEALRRANRALQTISRCNQILFHAEHEGKLLDTICQLLVSEGGYSMAWIGFAEQDAEKTVRPAAQAGHTDGYLETVRITWSDTAHGQGPTGKTIRTGKPHFIRDIRTDPSYAPWRDAAGKRGYGSSIALPLATGGQVLGVLNLYARQPEAFDSDEIGLLSELADDLAYGITAMRTRVQRNLAEEALRESEEKYRDLVEDINDVIFTVSAEGIITYISPAVHRMTGYTPEELVGHPFRDVIDPEDLPGLEHSLRDTLENRLEPWEFRYYTQDGQSRWARTSSRPISEDGRAVGIRGVFSDVTERKRFDEALLQSESLYRSLFENMMNGLAYCRMLFDHGRPLDFIYLSVNEAFETQTGLKDVVGKRASEVIPGIRESDPELLEIYGRVARTGQSEAFEIYVSALKMWFSISVYSPQKEYFVTVFDVITERKRADEALRESEEKYRGLFENAREAIVIINLEKTITDANRFVEEYGFRKEDLIGRSCLDFIAEPYREKASEDFERLRAGVPLEGEFEVMTPKGRIAARYLDSPIMRGGNVWGVQAIMTDITERKRIEQQLLDYQNKLRELAAELTLAAERERRRIAVGVHDQIGQRLAMTKLTLQSLPTSTLETNTLRAIEEVCKDIDKVLEDAHSLTFELSNPILYEVGFEPAVESWP